MRRFVYQIVERLADPGGGLSRNRNFELFSTPAGKRALKLHRHLRSLEQDLLRDPSAALSLRPREDGFELRLELPALRLVRTAQLTREDLDSLLHRDGPLSRALSAGLDATGAGPRAAAANRR